MRDRFYIRKSLTRYEPGDVIHLEFDLLTFDSSIFCKSVSNITWEQTGVIAKLMYYRSGNTTRPADFEHGYDWTFPNTLSHPRIRKSKLSGNQDIENRFYQVEVVAVLLVKGALASQPPQYMWYLSDPLIVTNGHNYLSNLFIIVKRREQY